MRNKKLAENSFVLTFNGILLLVQSFVFVEKIDDLTIFLLIYIPIIAAYFIVFMIINHMNVQYNNLIATGTIIKARLNHEMTKVVFAVKGLYIIKISCSYFDDTCTHVFEEQYACDMYRYRKIKKLMEEVDTINVLVSEDFNNCHIFVSTIEGNTYKDDYFFVPPKFNYFLLSLNMITLLINTSNLLH